MMPTKSQPINACAESQWIALDFATEDELKRKFASVTEKAGTERLTKILVWVNDEKSRPAKI